MGTSTSRRSPQTPRYGAFAAALGGDLPTARVVSEMYHAAAPTWGPLLAGPALLPFAAAAVSAYDALAQGLSGASSPAALVSDLVRTARNEAIHSTGGTLAVALGERALTRVLVAALAGDGSLAERTSADAAAHWERTRGDDNTVLARRLVSEVVRQLALHVASRDVPQFVDAERRSVTDARLLVRKIADHAAEVGATVARDSPMRAAALPDDWAAAVTNAFQTARRLPGDASA